MKDLDSISKLVSSLEYKAAYTLYYMDIDGEELCYDLWYDDEDTLFCMQQIYLLNGKPEEIGNTVGYTKKEILEKLIHISGLLNFRISEYD